MLVKLKANPAAVQSALDRLRNPVCELPRIVHAVADADADNISAAVDRAIDAVLDLALLVENEGGGGIVAFPSAFTF